jgi:hypothetical protein
MGKLKQLKHPNLQTFLQMVLISVFQRGGVKIFRRKNFSGSRPTELILAI